MNKSFTYSRLESIGFNMSLYDIYVLLDKAGEIPKGFEFDWQNTEKTDQIVLIAKRVTDEPPSTAPPVSASDKEASDE